MHRGGLAEGAEISLTGSLQLAPPAPIHTDFRVMDLSGESNCIVLQIQNHRMNEYMSTL